MHNHIAILGNGKELLDVDLERLVANPNIITVGINRVWKLIETDYLFCADIVVLDEMLQQGFDFENTRTKIFCSYRDLNRWIQGYGGRSRSTRRTRVDPKPRAKALSGLRDRKIILDANRRGVIFTSSMALRSLGARYTKGGSTFYMLGMPLNAESPHFWKGDKTVKNNRGKDWMRSRMRRQLNELRRLGGSGYRLVNTTPGSKLAQSFPTIQVDDLYNVGPDRIEIEDEEKTLAELRKRHEKTRKKTHNRKGKRRTPRRREEVFDYRKIQKELEERDENRKQRSGYNS